MTCIVGIETSEGSVVIGGDSAGVSYYDLTVRGDPKVFKRGGWIFGYTTSFRMGQVLQHKSDAKKLAKATTPHKLVDVVSEALKDHQWLKVESGRAEGGTFLAARGGRLLTIHSDLQYGWARRGYASVGCGEGYALGYLRSHIRKPKSVTTAEAKRLVRMALKAAEFFSAGVHGPFKVVTT